MQYDLLVRPKMESCSAFLQFYFGSLGKLTKTSQDVYHFYLRNGDLGNVADNLQANHDYDQLYTQVQQATGSATSIHPATAESLIVPRGTDHDV